MAKQIYFLECDIAVSTYDDAHDIVAPIARDNHLGTDQWFIYPCQNGCYTLQAISESRERLDDVVRTIYCEETNANFELDLYVSKVDATHAATFRRQLQDLRLNRMLAEKDRLIAELTARGVDVKALLKGI